MKDCSRLPACEARFLRRATTAAPTGERPRWIPPRACSTLFRGNTLRSTNLSFLERGAVEEVARREAFPARLQRQPRLRLTTALCATIRRSTSSTRVTDFRRWVRRGQT